MQNDLPREEILVTWKAPLRVSVPKSREYIITLVAITSVVALVLFVAEGIMPVILIGALFFLYWNLQKMPTRDIDYQLTNLGVKIGEATFSWDNLSHFWEEKRGQYTVWILGHEAGGRITLYTEANTQEKANQILSEKLKKEALPKPSGEKLINFVASKLPQ